MDNLSVQTLLNKEGGQGEEVHITHPAYEREHSIDVSVYSIEEKGNKENPSALSEIKQFKCLVVD